MQLRRKSLKPLQIIKREIVSDRVGSKEVWSPTEETIFANIQNVENQIIAAIYGEQTNEMLYLYCSLETILTENLGVKFEKQCYRLKGNPLSYERHRRYLVERFEPEWKSK